MVGLQGLEPWTKGLWASRSLTYQQYGEIALKLVIIYRNNFYSVLVRAKPIESDLAPFGFIIYRSHHCNGPVLPYYSNLLSRNLRNLLHNL